MAKQVKVLATKPDHLFIPQTNLVGERTVSCVFSCGFHMFTDTQINDILHRVLYYYLYIAVHEYIYIYIHTHVYIVLIFLFLINIWVSAYSLAFESLKVLLSDSMYKNHLLP